MFVSVLFLWWEVVFVLGFVFDFAVICFRLLRFELCFNDFFFYRSVLFASLGHKAKDITNNKAHFQVKQIWFGF